MTRLLMLGSVSGLNWSITVQNTCSSSGLLVGM